MSTPPGRNTPSSRSYTARSVDMSVVSGMTHGIAPTDVSTSTYRWLITQQRGSSPGMGSSVCVVIPMMGRELMSEIYSNRSCVSRGLDSALEWATQLRIPPATRCGRQPGHPSRRFRSTQANDDPLEQRWRVQPHALRRLGDQRVDDRLQVARLLKDGELPVGARSVRRGS